MFFEGFSSTKQFLYLGRTLQFSFSKLVLFAAVFLFVLTPKQGNNFGDLARIPTWMFLAISLIIMPEKCNIVCATYFSKKFILH